MASPSPVPNPTPPPGGVVPPKPPRPFTEYHVFFQLERNYILQTSLNSSHIDTTVDFTDVDEHASARPPKYRSLILPREWHVNGSRPKSRSRRKTHGKISFVEMTKLISRRWREADGPTRGYCRDLAKRELERYRERTRAYAERYGEDAMRSSRAARRKKQKNKGNNNNSKVSVVKSDGRLTQDADADDEVDDPVRDDVDVVRNRSTAALPTEPLLVPLLVPILVPQAAILPYINGFGGLGNMLPRDPSSGLTPADIDIWRQSQLQHLMMQNRQFPKIHRDAYDRQRHPTLRNQQQFPKVHSHPTATARAASVVPTSRFSRGMQQQQHQQRQHPPPTVRPDPHPSNGGCGADRPLTTQQQQRLCPRDNAMDPERLHLAAAMLGLRYG